MVTLSMCGSWHLKGKCMSDCKRRLDHSPHSEEEDDRLDAWCTVALGP
jgi:hypothetical protein